MSLARLGLAGCCQHRSNLNTFGLSLDSPSEFASVLFLKRYGFYNVTVVIVLSFPEKGG